MFTGIVEEVGALRQHPAGASSVALEVAADRDQR